MSILVSNPIEKRELKNKLGKLFCTLTFDADKHCNHLTWEGYCNVEDVKIGLEEGLRLLEENNCPNMINDSRLSTGPWAGANEWIITDWSPRAFEQGLRHSAMIVSSNVFSAMSAQQLQTSYTFAGVDLRTFATREDAASWFQKG